MTRLLLVHIAKTGGTSLRRLFKATQGLSTFDCVHNGTLLRFRDGKRVELRPLEPGCLGHYDQALVMMRHPLMRLSSCHRYFLGGGLNQRRKGVFPQDAAHQRYLQQVAPSLADCCQRLPQIAERIPHFQSACHWLDQLPNPLAELVFCGRQERFQQDLQRWMQLLKLDPSGVMVEQHNASTPFADVPWDPQSIRLAEQFYAADFQRFGYEFTPLPEPQLIQYWDQPEPPPELLARMERWKQLNPSWRYHRYDRDSAARLIGSIYGMALEDAFLDIRLPAMQADVFRIAVLNARGGLWIDAATTCRQPLDAWFNQRQPLLLLRRAHQQHPKVWNGFIHAAAPGHPLLSAAWHRMASALLARSGERVYRDFGPGLLRDLMAGAAVETASVDSAGLEAGLQVLQEQDVQDQLQIGSSSEVLPGDQHWSKRQQTESLYLSGG